MKLRNKKYPSRQLRDQGRSPLHIWKKEVGGAVDKDLILDIEVVVVKSLLYLHVPLTQKRDYFLIENRSKKRDWIKKTCFIGIVWMVIIKEDKEIFVRETS